MRIAVLKNWGEPDLARQWPAAPPPDLSDVAFDFAGAEAADFVAVFNGPATDTTVDCPPDRIWAFIQEPPNPYHAHLHDGQPAFARIYTTDSHLRDRRHRPFFGALQWHVGKSYDELTAAAFPEKTKTLSWITSNASRFDGHKLRMRFLRRLQRSGLEFSLYGRGFTPIADKWDGIAPFRYSIAFENFAEDLYWSEKLTDCFLGFATPFYYGSPTIDRYFPKDSYIAIDPYDRHVLDRMRDRIAEGFHENHIQALREARDLCLKRYNTLFYVAREALAYDAEAGPAQPADRRRTQISGIPEMAPSRTRWLLHLKHRLRRLGHRLQGRR